MTEKDHYRYGMDRKIDPSIPVLRQRIRDLEITLRSAHAELEEHGHQELPECECRVAQMLRVTANPEANAK